MYIVVTGAAGFIGSNLVRALNARGETRHHRRRQPAGCRQVSQSRGLRRRGLPRPGRIHRAHRRRRLRGRHHCGAAPGRMRGHDGDRWPLHDAQQLPLLGGAARSLPGQRHSVPVRVERVRLRRGHAFLPRIARTKRRSTCTATRSSCSTSTYGACCQNARRRWRVFAISTYTDRESSTRGRWPPSRSTSITSSGAARASSCSKARADTGRRAAPGFRVRRRRGQGQPRFSRPPAALRNLQRRHRPSRDVQCRRARDGQRMPRTRRQVSALAGRAGASGARSNTSRSRRRSSENTRALRKPTSPRCVPRVTRRRC